MKRFDGLLSVLAAVLIVLLVTVGIFNIGTQNIFGRVAVLSLATASPEGVYNFFKKTGNSSDTISTETSVPQINYIGQTAAPSDNKQVSVAITQQKMGSILKKSMSPYGANTKENNVYINNKMGEEIDIAADLSEKLGFEVTKSNEPQILIYHTHTTEAFMDDESQYYTDFDEPRTTDCEKNIVKIGEIIKEQLEKAGYKVVHDKTIHDYPAFSGSYNRSAETVNKALKEYPSIKIAIDVHRDTITSGNDKIAPVVNINGKEAAQVMLVMGSQTGSVTNYPNWRQNLRLATKLQYVFESNYPQFARAMLLKSARYNQQLTTGSILLEVGSDANTFEQAKYSAQLVGQSLTVLLDSQ